MLSSFMSKLNNLNLKEKFITTFFIIFLLAIFAVGYLGFSKTNEVIYNLAITKDKAIISDVTNDINTFVETIPRDLYFLASSHSFTKYLLWKDIGEKNLAHKRKQRALSTFLSFSKSKKYFYKVRYIDKNGKEKIVVKYDKNTNTSTQIPNKDLQNKKDREYFKAPISYGKEDLYVSDLDLNKEFGNISYPYVPVVRFAIPIIGDKGAKHGVFVLNIYADYFLDRISKYQKKLSKENREIYLVNNNGFYLFNKDEKKLWGKDLGHKMSLKIDNPEFFNAIAKKDNGIFEDESNIYTYKKIYPSKFDNTNYWTIYTVTDKKFAFKDLENFKLLFISIVLLVLSIVLYLINRYISQITKPLFEISEHLNILSLGKVPKTKILYKQNDEIGAMINSMQLLSNNSSNTTKQVKLIASGDLTKSIELLSSEDELGIAINGMTKILNLNSENSQLDSWFSNGLGELAKLLSAEMSFEDLADKSTAFICRYLEMGKGVFYVLDKEENILTLTGSYMHTSRDTLGDRYAIGEGNIGQVVKEKKPILLMQVKTTVNLALNDLPAQNSYTFPLIYEDEVYGAIELISLNKIDQKSQDFLIKAQETISGILYSVEQREKIEKLFEKTKESQENLQTQSEELQQTNAQMEEQQQQLEEANAQMEEQQQQLEANSKILEEKNKVLITSQKELDQRAEDLELSNKYKSEFLANMSHELRTPLNSIILLSEMLGENKEHRLNDAEIKKAKVINSSGNELLRLINDVLDLSKVEAGKMELIIDEFDSTQFCQEIQDQFEHTANQKKLEFLTIDEYNGQIINDKDRLSQIVRNLLSNSLKFTKNGTISFKIENGDNNNVEISVIDTGIGIPKDKLKSIFGAFQQVDGGTSREYGGTGLGLSISKKLVEMMGGKMTLDSKEGEGSKFTIIIPNLETLSHNNLIENTIKDTKPQATITTVIDDRDKINALDKPFLIIEDDETFAQILKEKINDDGDLAIVALTGKDGIELAKKYTNIKGVMLDLGLPDMDGIDVLKEFKINMSLRKIPVYIISGQDRDILTKNYGAIGFTHKPISNDGIKKVINKIKSFNSKEVKDLLIVEDNKTQRETLIEFIGNSTVKSKGVESASEAIEELDKGIYDSVIIDLKLKDGTGYEVCEHIAKNNIQIPIIIYTGQDLTKDEEAHLRKYTDSIIIKTASSEKRLLDEVDMFMHRVKVEIGDKKQNIDEINLNNKKILLVDDDIRNIYVLSELLNSKGADILTASNGQEAIDVLNKNLNTDIILMDIMMPIMDGYEATKIIKNDEKTKDIPIIALTAKAMKEDKEKAFKVGCDDYITKPLQMNILIGIIKGWLNKK